MNSIRFVLLSLVVGAELGAQSTASLPETATSRNRPHMVHLEAMAFDGARSRLVLFGGGPGAQGRVVRPGETWEWTGHGWQVAVDSARGPGGRAAHGMGYDPVERHIVLYGGVRDTALNSPGVPLCDTWVYDGRRWTRSDRAGCVTSNPLSVPIYDYDRRVMLLVEGGSGPTRRTRLWRWNEGSWTVVDSTGGPRRGSLEKVAYDRARSRLVAPVFSGPDSGVWEWDGQSWQQVTSSMPPARTRYALAYDARSQVVVLLNGRGGQPSGPMPDAWTWNGRAWSQVGGSDPLLTAPPAARMSATMVEDLRQPGLFLFGGVGSSGALDDLWRFDHSGWTRLIEPSTRPAGPG